MQDIDLSEITEDFKRLGVEYRWETLNMNLKPEANFREFVLVTHFYYSAGQAEFTIPIALYHVKRNFEILLKLIRLKNLNIEKYYCRIYTDQPAEIWSGYVDDVNSPETILTFMNDAILYRLEHANEETTPLLLSTEKFRMWITEIRFVFKINQQL
jgi:hypothetical protein